MKYFFPAVVFILLFAACSPDFQPVKSGYTLSFSSDTISFDTVFSQTGTSTHVLKVYNKNESDIEISRIKLGKQTGKNFLINVDGVSGQTFENVRIRANDSLFIFIKAYLPSNEADSVMFVADSLVFSNENNEQFVHLVAWSEDVILIDGEVLGTQTLTADKPYVVFNSMMVDTGQVLTLNAGTRMYFHHKSRLYVAGTLICNGTQDQPVQFMGDRLDYFLPDVKYNKLPGQWEGIWFFPESRNNVLKNTIVANAVIGIQAGALPGTSQPDVLIDNALITNHSYAALFAINAKLKVYNSEISNAGTYLAALVVGGNYDGVHNTFANYYYFGASNESPILLSDNVIYNNVLYTAPLTRAHFYNCIFDGMQNNSVTLSKSSDGAALQYLFSHCMMQYEKKIAGYDTVSNPNLVGIIWNEDAKFKKKEMYNFNYELDTLSPALNKASLD